MKYLFSMLFLVTLSGIAVSQSCHGKSMATSGGKSCCSAKEAAAMVAADKEGIQVRKDVASGDLSYFKVSTCAHSGSTSIVEMKYDTQEKMFVNKAPDMEEMHAMPVSSHSTEMKKMDCSKMSKAECAEKMAKGECQMKAKT